MLYVFMPPGDILITGMKDEDFEQGYQNVPVDWGINSERKREFFEKLKEITGY
jgi:hypothetical protein